MIRVILLALALAGCARDSYQYDPTYIGVKRVENAVAPTK